MVRLFNHKLALCFLTCLLTDIALTAKFTNPKKVPKNAVLLSKVSALTVRAGEQTASRRVKPVPQLQCVGPADICKLYTVDVMRCTNEGADYDENNVQWSCKASLPEEFKLGSTDVSCEGYLSSEDPYVLSGSCGVEYRLLLTEKGEARYGSQSSWGFGNYDDGKTNAAETFAGYLFMALFLGVLFIILRGIYRAWRDEARRRPTPRPRGGGGGGFWGGGDDDPPNDPPPPYSARPKKATWSSASRSGTSSARTQQDGWRPGFWTGTTVGATVGYLAGRGNQTQTEQQPSSQRGWTGGGGGYAGPSTPRSSGSGPSYSSGTRHESTGFGGTSRR